MISVCNVCKKYSDQVQIGPINLEIKQAGVISIIGPNGAGKSTTALMIGRLLKIDSGQICVAGCDVGKTSSRELSKVLAILKQENHFITKLTVKQLVSFGRFPHSHGRINQEDVNIIQKYLDFFELTNLQDRYLNELSGGQRQRAYVAMVLCQETQYIILDEPLNNLDISKSVQMMQYLKQAASEFNKTILIVLHDINFAAKYSDKICAMKDGKVVAFGNPEEIMQAELLSAVFDTKIHIIDTYRGKVAVY